ncbi:GNAT family N-acetyltransferase [Tateyamaria sp. SN6-1]|uniref:GNAT family N-acetyltransferase n=1 Tax=Tateyamaria sp. SN6-1 TaxID=3092148 RepID=UPI0039F5900C
MSPTRRYRFRPVRRDDRDLLMRWQRADHVRRWWGTGDPLSDQDLADTRVARWIVSQDDRPFAYMQDYDVHGWADHHFAHLPAGSRGIDQYIGVADMLGAGHGPGFMNQHLHTLFAKGAPVIATDPHPENARAIAAYRKCGFAPAGPPQDTPWGRILPMTTQREPDTS